MEAYKNEKTIMVACGYAPITVAVEGEAALPAGKPEIGKVLMICPQARVEHTEAMEDRIMAEGVLTLTVCYLSDDGVPYAYEASAPFRQVADAQGVCHGAEIEARAIAADAKLIKAHGRSIRTRTEIELLTEARMPVQMSAMSAAQADGDITVLQVEVQWDKLVSASMQMEEITGEIAIPSGIPKVDKVLCSSGVCSVFRTVTDGETLGIEGELAVSVLYATGDDTAPIAQLRGRIELNKMIPIDEPMESPEVFIDVERVSAQMNEAGDAAIVSALCRLNVASSARSSNTFIADAYSCTRGLALTSSATEISRRCVSKSGQITVRERAEVSDQGVARILACMPLPTVLRAYAEGNTVHIEGEMSCSLTYTSFDGTLHTGMCRVPVRAQETVDIPTDAELYAWAMPDQTQAVPTGSEAEIRALMHYRLIGYDKKTVNAISDMKTSDETPPKFSGIVVYFAGQGDTMWNVAKRYRVNRSEIIAQNPSAEEKLKKGRKLIMISRP